MAEPEVPLNTDKYMEEAKELRAISHGAARDDSDARKDRTTASLIDMLRDLQHEVLINMKSGGAAVQDLKGEVRDLKDGLLRVEASVKQFVKAFPGGDADEHRKDHEDKIQKARDRHRFWQGMQLALAIGATGAVAGWLIHVIWPAFLMGPSK